ncbi:MAG TPA: thiamine pyrophosphate-binding protein [Solirubrobacterales bacterium]|nr:thiamine pyrophosphate-binding protein [Solirubrobacterales bacterium]
MRASDWIAKFLASQGVEAVYEVAGGMIVNLIDALYRDGQVRIVACHHEQAAGFAAEGHARMDGVPGVAMGTSGPGAINLLTALGSCHFDSTPAVFITGQVNRHERKLDRPVRQLGFQETDVAAMAAPIAKAAWRIETIEELPVRLEEAFALARSGRPGPVLVDIPLDLQMAEVGAPVPDGPVAIETLHDPLTSDAAARAVADLAAAERPLILAGGGLRAGRAVGAFRELVDALGVPVVNSLMGVDVLPFDHPLRVGMIGTYGNRWGNIALSKCDALLVLGSRLDIRQTGADVDAFIAGGVIHHVDVDPGEINNRVTGVAPMVQDLAPALADIAAAATRGESGDHAGWLAEIAELRERWPDTGELPDIEGINPNQVIHQLAHPSASAYVADVGQHQMWAAQSVELRGDQRFLTSGGMGAMGSGLPLATGAAIESGAPVVSINGDGGFQLNLQELQTLVRNDLPVKIVILDNGAHGMVRQFQESYLDGRYQSTLWGYSAPDFVAVAAAYGIPGRQVTEPDEVEDAIAEMWAHEGPYMLEVAIDLKANAYPKIAFGYPISEMEPFVAPKAMEAT